MTTPIRYGYASIGGAGGSGTDPTKVLLYTTQSKTASFTAAPGFVYLIDSTAGAVTVTLPAASSAGQQFAVKWMAGSNAVTLNRAGTDTIGAAATTATMGLINEIWEFLSSGSGQWNLVGGNKTLSSLDARYLAATETINTVAASSTAQTIPDVTVSRISDITLTGNCTLTFPTSSAGKSFTLVLRQDATGGRTVTWPSGIKWASGVPFVATPSASAVDVLTFLSVASGVWYGFPAGPDMR